MLETHESLIEVFLENCDWGNDISDLEQSTAVGSFQKALDN